MKKKGKTRKGFTLVEMVLVIAIIVILTSVLVVGVTKYLTAANIAATSVSQHNSYIDEVADAAGFAQYDSSNTV